MFAAMLVLQIVVAPAGRPLSPADAVAVLRASDSDRDMTDVDLTGSPAFAPSSVRIPWHPGEGPYGPFDDRLTRLDLLQRGADRWSFPAPSGFTRPFDHYAAVGPLVYREPFVGAFRGPSHTGFQRRKR